MNQELAVAKGKYAELKLQAAEAEMAVEEERRTLREATGPVTATRSLDPSRIVFLSARLVKAIHDLRRIDTEMATLREGYNL